MPLGTEVGLGPSKIVLDVDPSLPRKTVHSPAPIFGPCLLWPNGCMDQDDTSYGGRPQPGHIALDGDAAPQWKGARQPLHFRPMCIVAKRSPISETAELLSNFAAFFFNWNWKT